MGESYRSFVATAPNRGHFGGSGTSITWIVLRHSSLPLPSTITTWSVSCLSGPAWGPRSSLAKALVPRESGVATLVFSAGADAYHAVTRAPLTSAPRLNAATATVARWPPASNSQPSGTKIVPKSTGWITRSGRAIASASNAGGFTSARATSAAAAQPDPLTVSTTSAGQFASVTRP